VKPLLPLALLAAACAAAPRQPPAPVLVPVPTLCVTGDLPDEPARVSAELTGDSGVDLGIIAGSAIELRAWGRALLGIVNGCRAGRALLQDRELVPEQGVGRVRLSLDGRRFRLDLPGAPDGDRFVGDVGDIIGRGMRERMSS
jgi:hypothetical protein